MRGWRSRAGGCGASASRDAAVLRRRLGNIVHCHTVNRPHDSAVIAVEGEVETRATRRHRARRARDAAAAILLRATPLTATDAAIARPRRRRRARQTPLDRLHRADGRRCATRVDYRPGATDAATTAAEALRAGAGVCQDHAHLFIAARARAGHSGALCRRLSLGRAATAAPTGKPRLGRGLSSRSSAGSASIPRTHAARRAPISAPASGSIIGRPRRCAACGAARREEIAGGRGDGRDAASNATIAIKRRGNIDDLLRRALLSRTGS